MLVCIVVSSELIDRAKEFHGHVCPFLVLGLRMSEIAMNRLGIGKAGTVETIEENIIAIVEVNNCLVDGVQIATGCTFGNNSLVYLDLGKNALTLIRRGEKKGVRVYVDSEKLRSKYFSERALKLFEKVVAERRGSSEEVEELNRIWEEIGYKMASIPEEEFAVQEVEITDEIERAPIFRSVRCSKCGELVMESRATYINGEPLCYVCSNRNVDSVIGRGIAKLDKVPYRITSSL